MVCRCSGVNPQASVTANGRASPGALCVIFKASVMVTRRLPKYPEPPLAKAMPAARQLHSEYMQCSEAGARSTRPRGKIPDRHDHFWLSTQPAILLALASLTILDSQLQW